MTQVLEHLYIGSLIEASDMKWLFDHNVTHIVNAAEEIRNYFPLDFNYLNLNLKDIPEQSIYPVLEKTYQFILNALNKGGTVFVHCRAGISRSSSIIIYFLMKLKGLSYINAYNYVKSKHPRTNPNVGFSRQLVSVSPDARKVFPQSNPPLSTQNNLRDNFPKVPRMTPKSSSNPHYLSIDSLGPTKRGLYSGY